MKDYTFSERGDLLEVLDRLERVDGWLGEEIQQNPRGRGRSGKTISDWFERRGGLDGVNVIPGGSPGGCCNTLIVFIGESDDGNVFLNRILDATNHVGVPERCRGQTRNVVFYASWWNSLAWAREKHKAALPGVLWILKMPFAKPQVLP